jgi:N-acyl-D-aspartate/D-glutamate deacylase
MTSAQLSYPLNVLIRDALVVDGSGNPVYRADVAVKDGRILDIGRFSNAVADLQIDATGKVLAPGFIDPHSHSELNMLAGTHTAGIQMGVTTEFLSPDGFGFALLDPQRLSEYHGYLSGIYGDANIGSGWHTFDEYLDCFAGHVFNNVVPQVPHGTIRLAVKEWAAGPASEAELEVMGFMVRECMKAGAVCARFSFRSA